MPVQENKLPDDGLIRRYILGALSQEEAEHLDELSITDEEFSMRLQAVENDLVDAYVNGELAGDTLQSFNSHYLSSPLRREKVEIAKAFQNIERRPRGPVTAQQPARGPAPVGQVVPIDRPLKGRSPLVNFSVSQWVLAAVIALLIGLVAWVLVEDLRLRDRVRRSVDERAEAERRESELQQLAENREAASIEKDREIQSLRNQIAKADQASAEGHAVQERQSLPLDINVVAVSLTPQTRGVSQLTAVSIPSDADYVTLQLLLERSDIKSYVAELKSLPDNKVVWKSARLHPRGGETKTVNASIRSTLLKPERYVLELKPFTIQKPTEPVASYFFVVEKR